MRAKIRVRGTVVKDESGSTLVLESPGELDLLSGFKQVEFDDWQIENAVSLFREHRDLEPLLEQLLDGNPAILRNYEAQQLIADAARGRLVRRKGKVRTANMRERDLLIWTAAFHLHSMGYPLKNDQDSIRAGEPQKLSVCRMIGQYLNLSEDGIYSIVRKHGGTTGRAPGGVSWFKLADGEVKPELVLDHYLSPRL